MNARPALRAVVLAAGASSRLGSPKALADLGGRAALEHLAHALADGLGAPPIVVVGRHADEIEAADLSLRGARIVRAARWSEGRTTSLAAGLDALEADGDALPDVLVAPVDVPLVSAQTVAALARAWDDAGAPPRGWLAPRFSPPGDALRYGHPVALGRALASEARGLPAGSSLRALRSRSGPLLAIDVEDAAVLDDLDTVADLEKLRSRLTHRD